MFSTDGEAPTLDLSTVKGDFTIEWFNPRTGGVLEKGTVISVGGGETISIGLPSKDPGEDWLAVVRAAR